METRLSKLQAEKRRIEAEIDEECRRLVREAHERSFASNATPKWDALTTEQQRYCQFMGFDPDNPDIPLD